MPISELLLNLTNPQVQTKDNTRRATAVAKLTCIPPNNGLEVVSGFYRFTTPLGPIELGDLSWYFERYCQWPTGPYKTRARKIEESLLKWGNALLQAATGYGFAREPFEAWKSTVQKQSNVSHRFSVQVDGEVLARINEDECALAQEAASDLLSLPWEIMHDNDDYLFRSGNGVQVRRRLPHGKHTVGLKAKLPLKVLLVSPRPEIDEKGNPVNYIDHRISSKALVQAKESLGENLLKVDILHPPTFSALKETLEKAAEENAPYQVIHFDGHGVYNQQIGMGALCFEDPCDEKKIGKRLSSLVYADELALELRAYRISLVYLDACQTAQTKKDPKASVAAKLLEEGVGAVVAMSYSVLIETARRFVEPFYKALMEGKCVGDAMLAGQRALYDDTYRFQKIGAGALFLQDWFVPVLYQEKSDIQLFPTKPGEAEGQPVREQKLEKLGALPQSPEHSFVGRSRMLLKLERFLKQKSYAVIRGGGGIGKTALAVELVRWLVRSGQFEQGVFVSVEPQNVQDVKGVLNEIGRQLIHKYAVATYGDDFDAALHPIEKAIRAFSTVFIFDNMESVLPDAEGKNPAGVSDVTELLALCERLQAADNRCRVIFTSRERLPMPFGRARNILELEQLSESEAILLVERVITETEEDLLISTDEQTQEKIRKLVEVVNCHPRALVLLAREVAKGANATIQNITALMEKLERENSGDRENSLYASVELSLQRLPKKMREKVKQLSVLHGGAHINLLMKMLDVNEGFAESMSRELIKVGLAKGRECNYLQLDPALPSYLKIGQSAEQLASLQTVWAEVVEDFLNFLTAHFSQYGSFVSRLAILEIPNLVALMTWLEQQLKADNTIARRVADAASNIEQLAGCISRPKVLAQATALREQALSATSEWNGNNFNGARLDIELLLEKGNLEAAHEKAKALLSKAKMIGEEAYEGADGDLATAHWLIGRVFKRRGQAKLAINSFTVAQQNFKNLGTRGAKDSALLLFELADCLKMIGQIDEASDKYQESIQKCENLGSYRQAALARMELADAQRIQHQYDAALNTLQKALVFFQSQNELAPASQCWHYLGMLYQDIGSFSKDINQYEKAEDSYLMALQLCTQIKSIPGQSASLAQLGYLHAYHLNRQEDAVRFYREAAILAARQNDRRGEGIALNNIADALRKLGRYEEARNEILRAIACKKPFGNSVFPWTSFYVLYEIEKATGCLEASQTAWRKARDIYLDYRRQGGYEGDFTGLLSEKVWTAIQQNRADEAFRNLTEIMSSSEILDEYRYHASKLLEVLHGSPRSALEDDDSLSFKGAAEVLLLVERLKEIER
ncbi:MAG: CHAT domain-containing protein [Cyanobacteria bacterium J06649_4]